MYHKSLVSSFLLNIHSRWLTSSAGIFSSTVKENILFGEEYNSQLFRRVIHAAALEPVG